MKKWMLRRNKVDTAKMARLLNIEEPIACVLANRGITSFDEADKFINGGLGELMEPELIKDMKKGTEILIDSINKGKKVAVYGDYDVDGVMSTAIIYKTIKDFNGDVVYYIPHRQEEGYGLNISAIKKLKKLGVQLLFTCDNGIASKEEIKYAKQEGMDVIVLDHHEPAYIESDEGIKTDIIPPADAIIDPKQKDCCSAFKMMCAGGLAFKFSKYFYKYNNREFIFEDEFLTLGAIATVCDIVDLVDENRIITKEGILKLNNTRNIGLKVLIEETGIKGEINEYHIGFVLGPCINATGRLESAKISLELIIEEDEGSARKLAKELVELNNQRKQLTMESADRVIDMVDSTDLKDDKVLVLYDETVHESIAGIVAGRVKEKFYKPTIVITKSEDLVKGSARSIEGYNIFEELYKCGDLFTRFGGHPMAAGFSMEHKNVGILKNRLNEGCNLNENDLSPVLRIEKQLTFNEINFNMARQLINLAPFGKGNHMPYFACKHVVAQSVDFLGNNKKTLKFKFFDGKTGKTMVGISFSLYDEFINLIKQLYDEDKCCRILNGIKADIPMDILFNIGINSFSGYDTLQLIIKDLRPVLS